MLRENISKPQIYKISFTLDELRPLIIKYIDIAQDHNSFNSLLNLTDYNYYHEQLINHYKQIGKKQKPSKVDKLAYIVLLSNPKRKIIESKSIEDFKLFSADKEADFKIWKIEEEPEDGKNCICSYEHLKVVVFVKNIHTGIVLQIGSECIKKCKLVSKIEFESKKKLFNEIMSKRKEKKLEIDSGLPIGYFEEQRQLIIKNKEAQKAEERKQKEKKKHQKKIDSANYRFCYVCDDSLMKIKNEKEKRICDRCTENDFRAKIINKYYKALTVEIKIYEKFECNNCNAPFISFFSKSEFLCKTCIKDYKIISCKICKTDTLLSTDSKDVYCEECDSKLISCIECNEITIGKTTETTRCDTCQLCYVNKLVLHQCCQCNNEFPRKQSEHWRTYCQTCFSNIEFPECICLKKMIQRTVKKEGFNKGRKFYVCREGKCKEFIWV